MNIRAKLAIVFSVVTVSVGVAVFFYLNAYLGSLLSDGMKSTLRVVAEISEGSYFVFTEDVKTRTIDWSSDGYIRNTVEKMIDSGTPLKEKNRLTHELNIYLKEKKIVHDPSVIIMDILDRNGFVVASSRADRVGVDEGKEERELGAIRWSEAMKAKFGEAFISSIVSEEDESTEAMTHATARIFSTTLGKDGFPLPLDAIVLLHFVRSDQLSGMLNGSFQEEQGGLTGVAFGKTYTSGEIYLVDKNGFLLTSPSRDKKRHINEKVSDYVISSCFKDGGEINEEYLNHDGIKVFGASMCIKRDNIMLLAEVQSDETFAPLASMRRSAILGILFTVAVIVLCSILFSSITLRPLDSIIATAREVSEKKYSARAPIKSKDEFGYLAIVFNDMLDKLEKAMVEAYDKAKDLSEKVLLIENQNASLEGGRKAMINLLEDARELEVGLQNERDTSSAIIASISEGLLVVDKNDKIILMNPVALKLLGVTREECLGKCPIDIISIFKGDELVAPEDRPVARTLKDGENVFIGREDNFYFQIPSGRKFPVAIATSLIKSGNLVGAVVIFSDITEDKLLDEAKSSFISTASHQLRTPLTSIRWYAEMLLDEDVGALNKEQKDFAQEVYNGAARLNDTINSLLYISRIESGKLQEELVEIELKPFVKSIFDELAPLISQKKLSTTIDIGDEVRIVVDKFMLHEVISNLLSNSIRYTNEGNHIALGYDIVEGEAVCSVADNGIGIPDNQKDKIFGKFFRAENAMSKVPDGSGLGLNLVKQFVEKWGGRIWFYSIEGKGSTFYFTIPPRS